MLRQIVAVAMFVLPIGIGDAIAQAPPPSSDEIVRKLQPEPRTRSLKPRGVKVEEGPNTDTPPSIDLYVNFEFNSARLSTDAQITLRNLGLALRDPRLATYRFLIAGHTDAVGGDAYNLDLSQKRAEAVRDYLVLTYAVDAARLKPVGYGKMRPLDAANPAAAVNRRVQIVNQGDGM